MKTLITAGGKGTRLLPITKEIPKEMLPIFARRSKKEVDTIPLLQLIFEQIYAAKIREFCFVVGRGKRAIKDYFSPDYDYLVKGKIENKALENFYDKINDSKIFWINQHQPRGFGDAVRLGKGFVGRNNFIVHAGDTAILGYNKHPILRLIDTANSIPYISAVLLCKKVKDPERYGILKINKLSNSVYEVKELEEKPVKPKSNFAVMPLYFFTPKIFDCLEKIKPGKNEEYQLTDAIQMLIDNGEKVVAITLNKNEVELDVGTVESYRQAQIYSYKKSS